MHLGEDKLNLCPIYPTHPTSPLKLSICVRAVRTNWKIKTYCYTAAYSSICFLMTANATNCFCFSHASRALSKRKVGMLRRPKADQRFRCEPRGWFMGKFLQLLTRSWIIIEWKAGTINPSVWQLWMESFCFLVVSTLNRWGWYILNANPSSCPIKMLFPTAF